MKIVSPFGIAEWPETVAKLRWESAELASIPLTCGF
jgi:hypothetical protein